MSHQHYNHSNSIVSLTPHVGSWGYAFPVRLRLWLLPPELPLLTYTRLYSQPNPGLDFDSDTPAQGEEITKDNPVSGLKSTVKCDSRE